MSMNDTAETPPAWTNPDGVGIQLLILGAAAAFGVVLVAAGLIGTGLASLPREPVALIDSLILLFLGAYLSFYWIWIGSWEGGLLNTVGAGVTPRTAPWYSLPLIALACVLFACLLFSWLTPPLFGFFLLLIKGDETLNIHLAAPRIDKGIEDALHLDRLPVEQTKRGVSLVGWRGEAAILDRFFFAHPWYHLATAYSVALGSASAVSAYLATNANADVRNAGFTLVAVAAAVCVVGNELIATRWRRQRRAEMDLNTSTRGQSELVELRLHEHYPLGRRPARGPR